MINIVRYDSLEECMAAFFDCEPDNLPDGKWEWMDGDRFRVWPMPRVYRSRRKTGTWGFCHDKREIHIWVAPWAKQKSVIRLIAHEMGHMQRPYHRTSTDEEEKAERYADVAQTAFNIMNDLLHGPRQHPRGRCICERFKRNASGLS